MYLIIKDRGGSDDVARETDEVIRIYSRAPDEIVIHPTKRDAKSRTVSLPGMKITNGSNLIKVLEDAGFIVFDAYDISGKKTTEMINAQYISGRDGVEYSNDKNKVDAVVRLTAGNVPDLPFIMPKDKWEELKAKIDTYREAHERRGGEQEEITNRKWRERLEDGRKSDRDRLS